MRASYEKAKQIRYDHGGYLLAYRTQYLVVDEDYIATLGLDPGDPDFETIDRDWVSPNHKAPRARLYGKLVEAELGR